MSAVGIAMAALRASSAITAVVNADYIFAINPQQNQAPPYIVCDLVSEADRENLEGSGKFYGSRVSISIIAASPATVMEMGEIVKLALSDIVKASIAGKVDVDIMKSDSDYTDSSDDRSTFRRYMDFNINWR